MKSWYKIIDDRERFFWVLQIVGWSGYALVHYLGSLLHESRSLFYFIILLNSYAGFLLTIPLRYFYQKVWEFNPLALIGCVLIASYVAGATWAVVKNLNHWQIYKYGYHPESLLLYFKYSIQAFFIMLCWSGLYFGIKYYQMLQQERQKALKANTMAHQAQLKMLRYQLNPHFLFNTLNAISTLILVEENKSANGMVMRLSEFLRYSLDNDPIKKVPLSHELQALELYLNIEKVRFDERLKLEFDIADDTRLALVPSLILQPLVENSIKYAIAVMEEGGTLTIRSQRFGNDLLLVVEDNGPGTELNEGKLARPGGVGVANTEERLHSLYDTNYSFVLQNNEPKGLKVSLRIPFELS